MANPLKEWRRQKGLSRKDLALASGLSEQVILQIELGKQGIPGELQDYLEKKRVNVSEMASQQSAFIAGRKGRKSA